MSGTLQREARPQQSARGLAAPPIIATFILAMSSCLSTAQAHVPIASGLTSVLTPPESQATDPPSPDSLLARAFAAFDHATDIGSAAKSDAAQLTDFRSAMLDAAIAFEAAVQQHPPTAGLHRNTATAYAFAGELGRAVLHARRAERLDPTDPAITAMLANLRTRVATRVDADLRTSTADALLGWRGYIPRQALLWTAVGTYLAALACAGVLLLRRGLRSDPVHTSRRLGGSRIRHAGIASAAVCILATAPLVLEWWFTFSDHDAVVIAESVTGYNGPNPALFDPTFDQPIGAGMEVRVIESDTGSTRVRLRNGQDTWIRSDSIEAVVQHNGRTQ